MTNITKGETALMTEAIVQEAFQITGAHRDGRWLVTCDHATNIVPDWLGGSLGLPESEMTRHIAYDIGALGLSEALGRALDAPVISSRFSRLVIDPNRGEDDPTLIMRLYDGTIIPANRHVDAAAREERLSRLHRPYHLAIAELAARHPASVIVSVHTFTPQLKGRPPRPWEVGVLYSPRDTRLVSPLIANLSAQGDMIVGDNVPYTGDLPGDAMDRHALGPGRLNALIELRQDLVATPEGQQHWANRLAPALIATLKETGL